MFFYFILTCLQWMASYTSIAQEIAAAANKKSTDQAALPVEIGLLMY